MKETKKVGRNIGFVLLGHLAGIAISFLYITLIPRRLGPERLGQFSYWISLSVIISAILDFGTSFCNRYISEFRVREGGKVNALLRESIKIDGIILLGLLFIVPLWLKLSFLELAAIFLGAIFAAIISIFLQIFYSYEKLEHSSFIRNVMRFVRIVIILVIIKFGIKNLIWAVFLPEFITILFYALSFKKILPKEKAFLPEGMRKYISFGLYTYFGTVCFIVLGRAIVILAKEMIGDLRFVGYTSIGVDISIYTLRIIAVSVFFGALPSGIRYLASDDQNRLDRFLELSWRYGNMIIFPICLGFLVLGDKLVGLFIGKEYLEGVALMFSFLPSAILLFWLQAHQFIFIIYEKKQSFFYSSLVSALGFVVMAMVLVTKIGIYGLPLSLGIGLFAGYVYAYVRACRFKPITNYFPSILKPVASGLIMFFIIFTLERISNIHMGYLIFIGAISYAISMVLLKGILREDYLKVKAIISS